MTRNKNKKGKAPEDENMSKEVLGVLRKESDKALNYKQIAAKLGIENPGNRDKIIRSLAQLAAKKEIEQLGKGKFRISASTDYYHGILDMTAKGSGYVVVEELEDDIFIPSNNLNKALNGDEVEVYI